MVSEVSKKLRVAYMEYKISIGNPLKTRSLVYQQLVSWLVDS